MNTQKTILILLFPILILFACNEEKKEDKTDDYDSEELAVETDKNYYEDGVLEVVTEGMEFQTADTINSGWNKIVYKNNSLEVHFVLLDIYPAGKTLDTIKSRVVPAFDEGMAYLMVGKNDSAMAAFGKLPEWFPQVRFVGGTGLISPQSTAVSTVKLEPGDHIMECYVKMANGSFHASHGMVKEIHVRDESTNLNPPSTNNKITISSTEGITMTGSPTAGKQIFEVNFKDQKAYEHFLGHDVNLVRYDNEMELGSLINWMNWMRPDGLKTPAPKGFYFMGGVNNHEAGKTGYFEAELQPGQYVLIAEVPAADKKGLFKKFTVFEN